ncbi:MAG: hypothetical protein JXA08_05180 [Methanomicrobiaceae archaeon]|nr:hypothetical protein [Methanomicrobiaceae archaeon]
MPGNHTCFFEAQTGMLIAFMEGKGVEPIGRKENSVPVEGPFACDHLSLAVGSDDELRALKDRLSAAGFAAPEITGHGIIHSLSPFDPNTIARECTSACSESRSHAGRRGRAGTAAGPLTSGHGTDTRGRSAGWCRGPAKGRFPAGI